MDKRLAELLNETFAYTDRQDSGKITGLAEAVRQHIKPGMSIAFVTTHYRPAATINEILRQFHGKNPGFTLIGRTIRDEVLNLIHDGLVKKAIVGWYGTLYPTAAPNPMIEQACRNNKLEIENQTFLTLIQRYMAGALGVGFMPTKSIRGSSIEDDAKNYFRIIENPFVAGEKMGVVKALNPDISLVHGWAADNDGNTILLPPFFEDMWGPLASKNGVIVTVEKIVSTQFIRDHSPLVRLPGYAVKSVSEVPFGAHPGGMSNHGLPEFEAYGEDYEYLDHYRRVCNSGDPAQLDNWINDWILSTNDHEDYLRKLGHERILFLKAKMGQDVWRHQLRSIPEDIFLKPGYSQAEIMVCASAHKIKERVIAGGYKTLLAGSGVNFLISSLVYFLLRKEGYKIDLFAELGHYGYLPVPLDPTVFSLPTISSCKMAADGLQSLGVWATGKNNRCLALIGVGQIDKRGNINTTRISEKGLLLTGSGGGNDVASGAQELFVVAYQSPKRFVDKVTYITSRGQRIKTMVSDLGIFEKIGNDDEFTLTGYLANNRSASPEATIANIRKQCGWDLKVSPQIKEIGLPSFEEVMLVRLLDPHHQFLEP